MRVVLLDVKKKGNNGWVNRDLAGGFGSYTDMQGSFFTRMLGLLKRRGIRLPLLSFAYLAAIFDKEGHHVEYRTDTDFSADLVLVASSIVGCLEEVEAISEIKRKGSTRVGVIGTFASVVPEPYLKVCDFVIRGEPEDVTIQIAGGLAPHGILESTAIEDLDSLPYPKWDIFPVNDYSYYPVLKRKPFITIQTSRGCPFTCYYYCPYTVNQGRKFRHRSVDNVMGELSYLTRSFNIRSILFRDPIFTLKRERALNIAKEMIKMDMDIHWACETHLSTLDESAVDLFYKAGLRAINVGVENCDEEILRKNHRQATKIIHQEKIIQYCEKSGVGISAFYILGTLHDTEESIRKVINYAKKLNTSFAQFAVSTPYPGTPYYDEIGDKIFSSNWGDFNGVSPVFRHPNIPTEKLLKLRNEAYKSYYVSFRWGMKYLKKLLLGI